jgi:hypothetical protein
LIIQTERNQSGYVFDGIDSNGQSVPLEIHFNAIYPQNNTCYDFDPDEPNAHPPPPQCWLCCDCMWKADVNTGLVFFKGDRPLPKELDSDEIV